MKISLNGEAKQAKDIGTGKGISFTLPDLAENKFLICAIELSIFEKKATEENYMAFGESKMIDNPTTLNISVDFGDTSRFAEKAKYKIAYRYHVKNVDDMSKIVIAGEDIKDGWRLIGEVNPQNSSDNGFTFYKNAAPTVNVTGISFVGETISGTQAITYTPEQLKTMCLPANALTNGITVQYTADDYDVEDAVRMEYKLIDIIENTVVSEGDLPEDNRIAVATDAQYFSLVLNAADNWGAKSDEQEINIMIDYEPPAVISEFLDCGRVLRGRNLYSKFTIMDDRNDALTSGNVYYSIRKGDSLIDSNIRLSNNANGEYTVDRTNMADGVYEIELTLFDKSYNKSTHKLMQTLDNTSPTVTFASQSDSPSATLYSTWINESKKIIFIATDAFAGVKKINTYLDNSYLNSTVSETAQSPYTFSYNVTSAKTGMLYYYFYVYDDAVTINKSTNSVNLSASGNSCFVSKYVWLDKTPPSVSIDTDENAWYEAPFTIYADIYDYPSASSVSDNSGVKTKQYEVTETELPSGDWQVYSSGVTFYSGGVFYLHIKAKDYAGNETIETKRIKVNSPAEITSEVKPTDDSRHTIYSEKTGLYVIKNTAYATKYHFAVRDKDINDTIKTDIVIVSNDNSGIKATATSETVPNNSETREVVFNLPYAKSDGSALPDGVYTMSVSLTEVKNDGSQLITTSNAAICEIVIKRNAPPTPVISAADGFVEITYPVETLAGSLNRNDIRAMYKREYKAVKDGVPSTNAYKTYNGAFGADDIVVTALYTDPAGNISTSSQRIFKTPDGVPPGSIITDGNTVTVEESRAANVYYIGTRRDKQKGLDDDICFGFMN